MSHITYTKTNMKYNMITMKNILVYDKQHDKQNNVNKRFISIKYIVFINLCNHGNWA